MDVGQSKLFTSKVSGGTSPYTYQWYLNGVANRTDSSWTFTPEVAGSYKVYINVTDNVGVKAKSNVATITVNKAPVVTVSPGSWVTDFGQTETFTATASLGSGTLHYQWYLDDAAVGSDSSTYEYTATSIGSHGVYVNVTDSASVPVTVESNTVMVTVDVTLSVSILPSSVTLDVGQSQTFTATASGGTPPYTIYYWGYGTSYTNAVLNASLNPTTSPTWAFTPSSTGFYYVVCIVTDSVGGSAPSYATVTVNAALSVTISPSSVTMDVGQSQTFTATASGGTPPYTTYYWGYGSSLAMADLSASLNPTTSPTWAFTPSSTGFYYVVCIVEDSAPCSQYSYVPVTVNAALVAPIVASSPSTVDQGQTSVLSNSTVISTGTSPYMYQWFEMAPGASVYSKIGGAASRSYSFVTSVSTTIGVWHFELNVTDATGAVVTSNAATVTVSSGVTATSGVVGITGYKLLFKETMNNTLSVPVAINYYWNFSVEKWNGAQWVASGMSGSTAPIVGYAIPALTTVNPPYYVYLLNSSTVGWNTWLWINYTFHWTYSGASYSNSCTAELNAHPGNVAGASVSFPYLGAGGKVGPLDLMAVAYNWNKKVSWTGNINPLDEVHIASITMGNKVGPADLMAVAFHWSQKWTSTPPPPP
jgi:hypothetical protein